MPDYRRVLIPGGTYFFTVNLLERKSTLLIDEIDTLLFGMRRVKHRHPFRLEALVVLPDHLHAIWTLPAGDRDYATRWRLIKTAFARSLPRTERRSATRVAKAERAIWQRRYWEHYVRDERDFAQHVAYCYYNPVKHGLVAHIGQWPHSTFHRDVRCGRQQADFDHVRGGVVEGDFGE